MSVRHPKNRLISFRLSESEYRALLNVCEANEASSLSDLVRATVRRVAREGEPSSAGFIGNNRAERLLRPAAEDDGLPESGGNGWEAALTKEVLRLRRRTDLLDREIRRLSVLISKR